MKIKAKFKIMRGRETLFTGIIEAEDAKFESDEKQRIEDLFNIERCVNQQGAYRMHAEIIEPMESR